MHITLHGTDEYSVVTDSSLFPVENLGNDPSYLCTNQCFGFPSCIQCKILLNQFVLLLYKEKFGIMCALSAV